MDGFREEGEGRTVAEVIAAKSSRDQPASDHIFDAGLKSDADLSFTICLYF
jgi:hypothetical protein